MTRRDFVSRAAAAVIVPAVSQANLILPVRRVMNSRAKLTPGQLREFSSAIWPEAVRDFKRCGIDLQSSESKGEVKRSPSDRPVFTGLDRGVINVVVTDRIPMYWDGGRALSGVTTQYERYHLCVIALDHAHGHQIPFLSLNTCVHELLHVLLQDIYVNRPKTMQRRGRELRIDWYATRLWLFHEGEAIRSAAQEYLERMQAERQALT
jgi:hypothetical protein